ncbi:MAG TPA: MerC domain-containing protein [Balneolaceae bacterium]|nr:MerC domain-containing protein [Balneolaceae bacterium]
MSKNITITGLWDRIGLSVSGICAVHCLLFPVLITTLPLWPIAFTIHEWAHPVFIGLLLPVVYFAARRSHFNKKIILFLVSGFLLIVSGWLIGHFWIGAWFETTATLIGSVMLIAGHWMNYRHHRTCQNKNHEHHPEVNNLEAH